MLKESNHSDDDVWEPAVAKKEKLDTAVNKRSRYSTNKRVICDKPLFFLNFLI